MFLMILTCLLLLISAKASASTTSSIVINELLPNPLGTDTGTEWIELYNPGNVKVFLDGWTLKDKTSTFSLNGKSIDASAYLVVYPAISLNNTDEEITLSDGQSYFDVVNYSASTEGRSLERIHHNCVEFIEHPTSDTKGIVNFNYNANGCSSNSELPEIFTKEADGIWKSEHIYMVGAKMQTKFDYKGTEQIVKIEWTYENSTYNSETIELTLNKTGTTKLKLVLETTSGKLEKEVEVITEPDIKLNEILPDPDGADTDQEWIEFYNPTSNEVDLNNWSINIGSKSQKIVDLKVGPKSFAILKTTISIPNTIGEISLISPSGLTVDSFQYGDTEKDKSWARIVDGEGEWFVSEQTKGITNLVFQKFEEEENEGDVEGITETPFDPELVTPEFNESGEEEKGEDQSEDFQITKITEVNEVAFGIFLVSELGVFVTTFLKREETAKLFSYFVGLVRG